MTIITYFSDFEKSLFGFVTNFYILINLKMRINGSILRFLKWVSFGTNSQEVKNCGNIFQQLSFI